ncbi:Peptidase S1, PA clan [Phytophthora cactorum]|nr:Peptidase S1, PA clan [Phytophthora cactorum]
MKLVFTLSSGAFALATTTGTLEGGSPNFYTVPISNFAPGNNISSDTIATSLQDTNGESNYHRLSVADLPSSNTSSDAIHSSLSKTSIVPSDIKTYVAGLRATAEGNNFCSASLITPTHLLVGMYCVSGNIRWASVGSHYVNGTQDGEQIKVVAMLNHPKSSNANFTDDFAVLVLEKPSAFKPVALAASDDSDVKDGEWAAKMGWDDTGGEGTMAYELTREDVQLMSNANCLKETNVDKTMLCSRGTPNVTSCTGDYSGPVVVEGSSGDVLVGLVSWGMIVVNLGILAYTPACRVLVHGSSQLLVECAFTKLPR